MQFRFPHVVIKRKTLMKLYCKVVIATLADYALLSLLASCYSHVSSHSSVSALGSNSLTVSYFLVHTHNDMQVALCLYEDRLMKYDYSHVLCK